MSSSDVLPTDQHCAHGFYFPGGCLYCANAEIERLRRDLEIQAVNATAVLQAQHERDAVIETLKEAGDLLRDALASGRLTGHRLADLIRAFLPADDVGDGK